MDQPPEEASLCACILFLVVSFHKKQKRTHKIEFQVNLLGLFNHISWMSTHSTVHLLHVRRARRGHERAPCGLVPRGEVSGGEVRRVQWDPLEELKQSMLFDDWVSRRCSFYAVCGQANKKLLVLC